MSVHIKSQTRIFAASYGGRVEKVESISINKNPGLTITDQSQALIKTSLHGNLQPTLA